MLHELQARLTNLCEDRVEGRQSAAEFLRAVSHKIHAGQPKYINSRLIMVRYTTKTLYILGRNQRILFSVLNKMNSIFKIFSIVLDLIDQNTFEG